jgi:nitrite reductase/ring-hydroxylating ferredoxin subunit
MKSAAAEEKPASPYRLPLFPASWYLLCASRATARGPVLRTMFGRELVAFRTEAGKLVVMDARCSHFGANLAGGIVTGETIQCPYHGWRYGPDGKCVGIPSGCAIPNFARQRVYPVQERHGYVFIFNGPAPSFPLPWFLDVPPDGFIASRPFEIVAHSSWSLITGHAFDLEHFLFAHDRRLLEPARIDTPLPYVRRTCYRAEVLPRNWRDKLLSRIGGRTVSGSLDIWGGTFAMITARFERFTSRFLLALQPIDRQTTLCQGIVFGRSSKVMLAIRRYFTEAYALKERDALGSAVASPARFVESDAPLMEYFRYLERMFETGETS